MSGADLQPVRSGATGRLIPCCWAECDRPGLPRFSIRVHETDRAGRPTGKITNYLFCSHRHRVYYANGVGDYGNLPSGSKSIDGHVQVPAPRGEKST